MEGLGEPIGGYRNIGDPRTDPVQEKTMYELSTDTWSMKKFGNIDIKTKQGQYDMLRLYQHVIEKYGMNYGENFSSYGVREAHVVWKDKRLLKRVSRIENGLEVRRWFDETYEERPEDIKVVKVWVDEVWEGYKLGTSGADAMYVGIRPIPGQYKSIYNPFGSELPYYGKCYNTHLNNAENVTFLDPGKPWQREFDTVMTQIKHDLATDVGKVFMMVYSFKPDNVTWQDWMEGMKNGKIVGINPNKRGFTGIDPQLVRGIDLSRTSDIAGKVQYLESIKNNLIQSMYFNPSRIGAVGQYATNVNLEVSQAASYNQTESWFETHRQITEKALNAFMNRAKWLYKDKPHKLSRILDDISQKDLELTPDIHYGEVAIEFKLSSDEVRRMEELRAQSLTLLQNGLSIETYVEMLFAKTPSEIKDIIGKHTKNIQEQQQAQIQLQQEEAEKQRQAEIEEKERERQSKMQIEREKFASQEAREVLNSQQFKFAADVDGNNKSDQMEIKEKELAAKMAIEKEKLELQKRELDIKEKELEIKRMEAKQKKAQNKN